MSLLPVHPLASTPSAQGQSPFRTLTSPPPIRRSDPNVASLNNQSTCQPTSTAPSQQPSAPSQASRAPRWTYTDALESFRAAQRWGYVGKPPRYGASAGSSYSPTQALVCSSTHTTNLLAVSTCSVLFYALGGEVRGIIQFRPCTERLSVPWSHGSHS